MNYIVPIDEIENSEDKTLYYDFQDKIEGVNSDGNISAELEIKSLGDFIQVQGNVKGILNLECDVCLDEYKYNLDFDIDEMYAKHALLDEYKQEIELKDGQFVTDLDGSNEINIYDLLYQSVILNIPNKKVCGINCNRGIFPNEENLPDPRMDVFKNIQIQPESK